VIALARLYPTRRGRGAGGGKSDRRRPPRGSRHEREGSSGEEEQGGYTKKNKQATTVEIGQHRQQSLLRQPHVEQQCRRGKRMVSTQGHASLSPSPSRRLAHRPRPVWPAQCPRAAATPHRPPPARRAGDGARGTTPERWHRGGGRARPRRRKDTQAREERRSNQRRKETRETKSNVSRRRESVPPTPTRNVRSVKCAHGDTLCTGGTHTGRR